MPFSRAIGEESQGLGPAGERAGEGGQVKEPHELARKVRQVVVVTLLECREVERILAAGELLRQRGLAHAPPAVKYHHLKVALGVQLLELPELLLPSYEHAFLPYYNACLHNAI